MAGPVKGPKRPLPAVLGLLPAQSFTFPLRGRTADTHALSRQLSKGSREQASERNGLQLTELERSRGQGALSLPLSTRGDPHRLRGEGVCPGGAECSD